MTNQWLSPNAQLLVILTAFVVIAALIGIVFTMAVQRFKAIEKKLVGPIVPFWQHALEAMSGDLKHPHPWAVEPDAALTEVNMYPEVLRDPLKYSRLAVLLHERVISTSPDLRENEKIVAAIYLLAMPLARGEGESTVVLSDIKLVGSKAPERQEAKEE